MTDRIRRFLERTAHEAPCLVMDLDRVRDNYEAFARAMPDTRVFYAIKANPAPQILRLLAGLGSCFDAASLREVEMALEAGATADRISFSNTIKRERDIAAAYRLGVRQFAFDCDAELEKIARVGKKHIAESPHEVLLVLDATTGQNGVRQAAAFSESIPVTGLFLAKIDGSARGEAGERALARLLPALAKYWHNRRGPGFMAEAMECLGGIGYVEEAPLARLYREAPVNSIWEGSGNVICLDVLRVLTRHPEALEALHAELAPARGQVREFDAALAGLERLLGEPPQALEPRARWLTQRLAQCLQGALLLRHAPVEVGETFCRARLGEEAGPAYGVLPSGAPLAAVLARIAS